MKFDVIVGNPPYKSGLHMKIFNKSFDLCKEDGLMSFIHPSDSFLNKKSKKRNYEAKLNENIEIYKSKLEFFDGNEVFGKSMFFTPLSLTMIKKEKKSEIEDGKFFIKIKDIKQHVGEVSVQHFIKN